MKKIIATFVAVLIAGLLLAGCGGERQTDETSQVWELPKISSGKAVFYQNGGQATKLSLNQNEMSSLEKRVRDTLASMERPLWVSLAVTPEQMSDYYKQGRGLEISFSSIRRFSVGGENGEVKECDQLFILEDRGLLFFGKNGEYLSGPLSISHEEAQRILGDLVE